MKTAHGLALAATAAAALIGCNLANHPLAAAEPAAIEARLIGYCGGRVLAAVEESSFPAGCNWIEPIRYLEDGGAAWRAANGGRTLRLGN